MSEADAATETRSYGRSAGLLTVAFGFAGGLIYVYFALASHNLDPAEYGQLVVLWTVVYVIAVTVFRPVEQFLAHALARPEAAEGERRQVLRTAAAIQLGIAAASVLCVLALRTPIEDELIGGGTAYSVLVASLIALAAWFFVRGLFAGTRRFGAFAAVLVLEAVVRVALALALAIGLSDDQDIVVIAIAAAPLASLVVLPFALARRGGGVAAPAEPPPADEVPPVPAVPSVPAPNRRARLVEGGGFAGALLVVLLCEQVILSAGPLFVRAVDGPAAAALSFNILMIARAPLLLFQAIATSMLPHLTRMWADGRASGEEAFRRSLRGTLAAIAAFAAALALIVAAVGPAAMEIAFGDAYSYDRLELVVVALATGLYLGAVALNQAVLAQGQVRVAAICWVACAALFALANLMPGIDPVPRMEAALIAVAAVLCGLLYAISRRPHPREADAIEPGSARELETQLAEEL